MFKVTKKNHLIAEECGNAESADHAFISAVKQDDRLMKENLKFYRVVSVYGDGHYPKITLKVGDAVITEAHGIDFQFEGRKYKIFDTEHIVSIVKGV